jgi:glycine/D-amino acid oxidase-like deaminating enzyme/nitrite reductase/ring-hydroxylating ferredoxin subunit
LIDSGKLSSVEGTRSCWMESSLTSSDYLPLRSDATADVCIVGAGIAGITTAYLLAKEGKSVVVLDDGTVGGGETGRTTAHLANAIDDRYLTIAKLHGEKGAQLAAESHSAAIDSIEQIVREEDIHCEFERVDGYLFVPFDESTEILQRELAAVHQAGLLQVEWADGTSLRGFQGGPCLRFPNQAQFHPLKYLLALASAIKQRGGRIHCGVHVTGVQGGAETVVQTDSRFSVRAGWVVVATNTPVNDLVAIHTKQAAYRTYVVASPIPAGSVSRALYWDTQAPYHYARLHSIPEHLRDQSTSNHELLIVGGEDHKVGQALSAEERYLRLEEWARSRFPSWTDAHFHWSGQIMEPIDGLAFIGRNPMDFSNILIATGDSGMGMTHGTIAGILLTDLIQGRENPWASLYDPSRVTLRAAVDFAKATLSFGAQYTDWITPGEVNSPEEVPPGTGAIVRRGLTKTAVYRDLDGTRYERSAVCPHLGCIVNWNPTEKSWDCPCHGSRFDIHGQVLNGPAIRSLDAVGQEIPSK